MNQKVKNIWILTMFPQYFEAFLECGIIGQVLKGERGPNFRVYLVPIQNYSPKNFKGVDDAPYGGGPGMIMRADVLKDALIQGVVEPGAYGENFREHLHIVFPGPRGRVWDHQQCKEFSINYFGPSSSKDLVFICGRYEGIDQRFIDLYVNEEISIGDYILSGGELAVQVLIDSSLRHLPGALGNNQGAANESHSHILLEHSQYTRPADFEGHQVPPILLSGHHKKIEEFQEEEGRELTRKLRPDLFTKWQKGNTKK
jgi:tRNA (guanine37-N1)-methyltransferase